MSFQVLFFFTKQYLLAVFNNLNFYNTLQTFREKLQLLIQKFNKTILIQTRIHLLIQLNSTDIGNIFIPMFL